MGKYKTVYLHKGRIDKYSEIIYDFFKKNNINRIKFVILESHNKRNDITKQCKLYSRGVYQHNDNPDALIIKITKKNSNSVYLYTCPHNYQPDFYFGSCPVNLYAHSKCLFNFIKEGYRFFRSYINKYGILTIEIKNNNTIISNCGEVICDIKSIDDVYNGIHTSELYVYRTIIFPLKFRNFFIKPYKPLPPRDLKNCFLFKINEFGDDYVVLYDKHSCEEIYVEYYPINNIYALDTMKLLCPMSSVYFSHYIHYYHCPVQF